MINNMNKKFFVAILLLTTVFYPLKTEAQTTTSETTTAITTPTITKSLLPRQAARQEARAEYQAKLAKIKDERKKAIVDKIDNRITTTNKNVTDRMTLALEKLTSYLTRITERTSALKAAGTNTASAESAIITAQTAITTAKTAVAAQAIKQYVITLGEESTLKSTIGTTISQFRQDLAATHKTVQDAKFAVVKAQVEFVKLTGKNIKNASGAATIQ